MPFSRHTTDSLLAAVLPQSAPHTVLHHAPLPLAQRPLGARRERRRRGAQGAPWFLETRKAICVAVCRLGRASQVTLAGDLAYVATLSLVAPSAPSSVWSRWSRALRPRQSASTVAIPFGELAFMLDGDRRCSAVAPSVVVLTTAAGE